MERTSGGRTGHVFTEVFSLFILQKLLGHESNLIYDPTWNSLQFLISEKSLRGRCVPKLSSYDYVFEVNASTCPWSFTAQMKDGWAGFRCEDALRLKKTIEDLHSQNKNILIKCGSGWPIVYLYDVFKWGANGDIPSSCYTSLIDFLRETYYLEAPSPPIRKSIALHIRGGDLYTSFISSSDHSKRLGIVYYKELVTRLTNSLDCEVNIYTESVMAGSTTKSSLIFAQLDNIKNVTVHTGGQEELQDHINEMVRSSVLILSPSCLSLFMGYLSEGLVLVDERVLGHRQNMMARSKYVFNSFTNIEEKVDLIKNALS